MTRRSICKRHQMEPSVYSLLLEYKYTCTQADTGFRKYSCFQGDVKFSKHFCVVQADTGSRMVDFVFHNHKEDFAIVNLLKGCAIRKDLYMGTKLHSEIHGQGFLDRSSYVASTLINMYVKCGELTKAQEVFDELPIRELVSWNALISGYAQQGYCNEAIIHFAKMQREGIYPSEVTFNYIVGACAIIGAINKGKQIHNEIVARNMLCENIILGTALVNMYAKCDFLSKAQLVFHELPDRDVISWNALMSGYAHKGYELETLKCFERLQIEDIFPNAITLIYTLKVCASVGNINQGKQIHNIIVTTNLVENHLVLGNALVDMYAKCGMTRRAQQLLYQLPVRDTVSWNALIAGYVQQGQGNEALNCYGWMLSDGHHPNVVTFISLLKACGIVKAIGKGKQIHKDIANMGFLDQNIVLSTALVDMYAKCGLTTKAQQLLDQLLIQHVTKELNAGDEATQSLQQMDKKDLSADVVSLVCLLKACGRTGAIDKGKQIHSEILNAGLLNKNIVLGNAIVDMYAKCGFLDKARQVLDELPVRNVVSWNALIAGFVKQGQNHEAVNCFERMHKEGLSPDSVSFICILKACGNAKAVDMGIQIHKQISFRGLLGENIVLSNTLVDMYAKCGMLTKAQQVVNELPFRDVVSWNVLLSGYVQQGQDGKALEVSERMQGECAFMNSVTFICILKACGAIGAIGKGKQVHQDIITMNLLEENNMLCSALVDMYARCGMLTRAQEVFDELPVQSEGSWNALIAGYVQQGNGQGALNIFERMTSEGFSPDPITFVCILKACGSIGAVDKGEEIHNELVNKGLLGANVVLGNALIDMYTQFGMIARAEQVLYELPLCNTTSWNILITGYSQQGKGQEAQKLFARMQREGFAPDGITILCLLNACCNSGLVDEAYMYFQNMSKQYHITPTIEHHTSMIDVFGIAGHFDKAMSIINKLPCSNHSSLWLALLSTCRKWGYLNLGRLAFDHVLQLDGDTGNLENQL